MADIAASFMYSLLVSLWTLVFLIAALCSPSWTDVHPVSKSVYDPFLLRVDSIYYSAPMGLFYAHTSYCKDGHDMSGERETCLRTDMTSTFLEQMFQTNPAKVFQSNKDADAFRDAGTKLKHATLVAIAFTAFSLALACACCVASFLLGSMMAKNVTSVLARWGKVPAVCHTLSFVSSLLSVLVYGLCQVPERVYEMQARGSNEIYRVDMTDVFQLSWGFSMVMVAMLFSTVGMWIAWNMWTGIRKQYSVLPPPPRPVLPEVMIPTDAKNVDHFE